MLSTSHAQITVTSSTERFSRRFYQDAVQHSDRATVQYHFRLLPVSVDTGSHRSRRLVGSESDITLKKIAFCFKFEINCTIRRLLTFSPVACR